MDPDSSSCVFIEAKETVDDLLSTQSKEEDSPKNIEESSTSPLIESEWVKELSQINPLKPKNTSASEEVIDADPISYKLPNEEKIRVYEPKMSFLKEQILTDLPETITPKDKAWINETDTLNKKNESRSGKSIPKRRKRTLALEEKYSADWDIRPNLRKSGRRVDYSYYLKADERVMCRSLREVERYEMTGSVDGHKGKEKKKERTEKVVKNMDDSKIKKRKREAEKRMTVVEKFLADSAYYRRCGGKKQPGDDYVMNLHKAIVPYKPSEPAPSIEIVQVPAKFYVKSSLLDFFDTSDALDAPEVVVSEEDVEDIFEEVIDTGDALKALEVIIPEEVAEDFFEEVRVERLYHSVPPMQQEERELRDSDYAKIAKAARDLDQVLENFLSRLKSYIQPSNPGP